MPRCACWESALSNLRTLQQPDLFAASRAQARDWTRSIDGIRDRFGSTLLTRASLLPRGAPGAGTWLIGILGPPCT